MNWPVFITSWAIAIIAMAGLVYACSVPAIGGG